MRTLPTSAVLANVAHDAPEDRAATAEELAELRAWMRGEGVAEDEAPELDDALYGEPEPELSLAGNWVMPGEEG